MSRVSSFSPADRQKFMNLLSKECGNSATYTSKQILAVETKHKLGRQWWLINGNTYRVSRGVYSINAGNNMPKKTVDKKPKTIMPAIKLDTVPVATKPIETVSETTMNLQHDITVHSVSLIPSKANGYVPFGHFNDVYSVIASKRFYPVFITGLSGNGKTMMVEQGCAKAKREMFRVNITIETDEDDLIGGFRLVNGATVWHNGPVVSAMERGAVLLLDEIDLASNKIMCLQPVLESKPIYLKKINKLVHPAPGFTVIATANTKGRGSDDGRFIGTNILNEAFLERYSITLEQEYPPINTEKKILSNVLATHNIEEEKFVDMLTKWADIIRRTFKEGGVNDIISTRRLIHICDAYGIFDRNKMKAIGFCLNRFDDDTKKSFMDLYTKVDEEANPPVVMQPQIDPVTGQPVITTDPNTASMSDPVAAFVGVPVATTPNIT